MVSRVNELKLVAMAWPIPRPTNSVHACALASCSSLPQLAGLFSLTQTFTPALDCYLVARSCVRTAPRTKSNLLVRVSCACLHQCSRHFPASDN